MGADDGEGLLCVCRVLPSPGHCHRPQRGILLAEIIPQVQRDAVPYLESTGFQQVCVHHAYGLSRVRGGDPSAFLADHPALRRPALGGHIVAVYHVEGMHVLVGHPDKLPEIGEFLLLQPVFRKIGDIHEVGPPADEAVVPDIELMGVSLGIGFIPFLRGDVLDDRVVPQDHHVPAAFCHVLKVLQEGPVVDGKHA